MKIKIKHTTTHETEVDIKPPYYCKSSVHNYCVYSEDHCIQVYNGYSEHTTGIQICHSWLPFSGNNPADPCTKEEFQAAFSQALGIISSKL